jgi:hypothetical protein
MKFRQMVPETSADIYTPVSDSDWMRVVHGVDMSANDYH